MAGRSLIVDRMKDEIVSLELLNETASVPIIHDSSCNRSFDFQFCVLLANYFKEILLLVTGFHTLVVSHVFFFLLGRS